MSGITKSQISVRPVSVGSFPSISSNASPLKAASKAIGVRTAKPNITNIRAALFCMSCMANPSAANKNITSNEVADSDFSVRNIRTPKIARVADRVGGGHNPHAEGDDGRQETDPGQEVHELVALKIFRNPDRADDHEQILNRLPEGRSRIDRPGC